MDRQRGFVIPVMLIVYVVGALLATGLVAGSVYKLQHYCNTACKDARAETVKQAARADAAERRERAAAAEEARVRGKWAQESVAAQSVALQLERERNARFQSVDDSLRRLPAADARLRFPAAAVGVLNAGAAAANAAIAGPATVPVEPARATAADSDVASVTAWGVTCAKQYATLAGQVIGWQVFYERLQTAQIAEEIH